MYYFANRTGLDWYVTFRSLIDSCIVHGLNHQTYLEQVLRLAPHWPNGRMLELSPKYWKKTLESLDDAERAVVAGPWTATSQVIHRRAARSKVA